MHYLGKQVGAPGGGVALEDKPQANAHQHPTVIVAAITSQINKAKLPTHVELSASEYGLPKDSVILLEQIRTIDKKRLREKICTLSSEVMEKVNEALQISLGLIDL